MQVAERRSWGIVDPREPARTPWSYQRFLSSSKAEFTVAKEAYVVTRSGWFSERSACYLAAGRPVVTQDTGFGCSLPLGEGLFAVATLDDAVAAIEAINANYVRHSNAAREIAQRYFRAETVLADLLEALA